MWFMWIHEIREWFQEVQNKNYMEWSGWCNGSGLFQIIVLSQLQRKKGRKESDRSLVLSEFILFDMFW